MSRLLRRQLRIGVGPDRIDIVQLERGWPARVSGTHSMPFAVPESGTTGQAVVQAFQQALRQLPAEMAVGDCSVTLGNAWVHYQLAPWNDGIADAQEYATYATRHVQSVYGTLADGWRIFCAESCYGRPLLTCAVERELIDGLCRVIAAHGLKLLNVRPFLSAATTRWRSALAVRHGWFALIDGRTICLLGAASGHPRTLRTQRVRGDICAELESMLRLEAVAPDSAGSAVPVYVFYPEASRAAQHEFAAAKMQMLDAANFLAPLTADARFALALT